MAEDGERQMLFDIRGRRKNVIRVVYAVLALLMGTSLFFVVGPVNLGEVVGNSATGSASDALDDQVERLEARLARNPNDEQLLLSLTRTQIAAGNAKIEPAASEAEVPGVTPEARQDFEAAAQTWNRYLRQTGEPNPTAAQLVAGTFFRLAESSGSSLQEVEEHVARATQAQRIAAEARPNLGSLSTLALYEYFNGDFAAGDETAERAETLAPSKGEAANVEKQLGEFRKQAKQFANQARQIKKAQQGAGREQLENPFRALGPPGGTASE